LNVEAPQPRMY